MSLVLAGLGLATSLIGAGINAHQNAKAGELAEQNYRKQRASLLTDMYANPLDSVANKALLSQMDRRLADQNKAIQNQAAASGATFENTLAAKQAGNDAMADVVSGIMQAGQARRDSYQQQLLNLDQQRTAQQMAIKQQSGQNWASLGSNAFGALTDLGGTMLANDLTFKDLLTR
jgi:hypothetical protein